MKSINGSITGLEKSAESFKTMLEKAGLHVELDVFKTGRGGTAHYGPSYISMRISNDDGYLYSHKVHAGGFGEIVTWNSVKAAIINNLMEAAE